jgi:ubiquinone biosynthesis accessory factor UbiJ
MKNEPPVFSSGPSAGGFPPNFLQSLLGAIRPPDWVVDELQNRIVLFLNHVLMQEKAAQDRLRRQKGKPVKMQWGEFHLTLTPTAAGLLERAAPDAEPELRVTLTQTSPLALAQAVLAGDKPGVDIQGDVQLAAEVAWLVDNVRWDPEEDLSRFVGDGPAHTLSRAARTAAQAVKSFVARKPPGFPRSPFASAPPAPAATPSAAPGADGTAP